MDLYKFNTLLNRTGKAWLIESECVQARCFGGAPTDPVTNQRVLVPRPALPAAVRRLPLGK